MKLTFTAVLAFAAALGVQASGILVSGPLVMDNEALSLLGDLSGRVIVRGGCTLPVSTTKPAGVVKEPAYRGTPYYGTVHVGNGPHADTMFVMDFAPHDRRSDNRLYFDR